MLFPWCRSQRFVSPPAARRHGRRRRPAVEILEDRRLLSMFTVLNTGDNGGINPAPRAGTGTLRQAIVDANATAGPNVIQFHIGTGAQTIKVQAPLPPLSGPVVLDGTTQPGFAGTPPIELDGAAAGARADGVVLAAGNSTVKGLAVGGFSGNGINLTGTGNLVLGDYVGTDLTGATALANGADGVAVFGNNNTVGGSAAGAGNLISGNAHNGVDLVGSGNQVLGNRVGTNAAGAAALGNGADGVIAYGNGAVIGGATPAAGNLVSGNGGNGIDLVGSGNLVAGNRVGTDTTGATALANAGDGVIVFSSGNTVGGLAGSGNLISGNAHNGVDVAGTTASGNLVQGNVVGTDVTGTRALANGVNGVIVFGPANTVGGSTAGAGNLISGNAHNGIDLDGNQDVVQGNLVGTDATGGLALGNGGDGVAAFSSANTIGGAAAGAGNVVSGNAGSGVSLVGGGNVVQGNWVGTDLGGTAGLGNGGDGVLVYGPGNAVGGNAAGDGNVLSANRGSGVDIPGSGATGNLVQGNLIGTDATGTANLGNGVDGVLVTASGNTIGDTTPAGENTIAFNQNDGLYVGPGTSNVVLQNTLFGNGPPGAQTSADPPPAPATSPQFTLTVPHPGRDTLVQVFDALSGQALFEFTAFPGLRVGMRLLAADVNGDGIPDVVVLSTGRRNGGRVRVIDGSTGQPLAGPLGAFTPFPGGKGVSLSVADFDNDGVPDLIVTARVGGRRMTKVYNGQTGALVGVIGGPSGRRRGRAARHRR